MNANVSDMPRGVSGETPVRRRNRRRTVGWDPKAFDLTSWRSSAACQDLDTDLFFPSGPAAVMAPVVAEAKAVCARCPVQQACLAFALATKQEYGIWGGYDEDEQRRLRRSRPTKRSASILQPTTR